jgi:hypothetical protein
MLRKVLPRALEIVALAVFVLLIYDNLRLRKLAAGHVPAAKPALPRAFRAGDTITTIPATDVNGNPQRVSFAGRSLVAVIDPACDSCRRVIDALPADGGAVVLSLAPPEVFRGSAGQGIRGTIYSIDPLRHDPRLSTYPQVLLVEQGRVRRTCAEPADCR